MKQAAGRVAAEQKEAANPNAPAIRAIRKAIEELKFKSFRYDMQPSAGPSKPSSPHF